MMHYLKSLEVLYGKLIGVHRGIDGVYYVRYRNGVCIGKPEDVSLDDIYGACK